VEELAHERAILMATSHGEVDEVARRVFALEGELEVAHQDHGATEEKLPSLVTQEAAAN
jgi:hypothetical protein